MDKRTIVYLVQLVLLYGHGAHQTHERLPKYVFIVKSCPHPNNIIDWEKASYRLNCLHPPTSTDTGNAYHCLPTSFSNETVEFCGEGIFVPPGHCPIYNYTDKADDKPGLYNCYAFTSGCPTERFSSKDVRKFPSCLNINREHGCYEEESSCPKTSVTQVPKETTNNVNTVTISTSQSIPTDSSPDIPTPDNRDETIYVLTILITCTIGAALIGQMISLRYMCIYRCRYLQMEKATTRTDVENHTEMDEMESRNTHGCRYLQMENATTRTDVKNHIELESRNTVYFSKKVEEREESTPLLPIDNIGQNIPDITNNRTNCNASYQTEDQNVPDTTTTNCDEYCQKEDMIEEKTVEGFQEFHAFLEKIGGSITDDTLHTMKTFLQDLMDQECVWKMNTTRLLKKLSDTFKLQYNMIFLEWIFEKCEDHQLVEQCQKFSAGHIFNLECFQTNVIACGQNQHLKFQLMMTDLGSHMSEHVQDIRYWLAKSIKVHPGQIIMTALQSEPIVVTFMMKKADVKTFLKYIETDDGQIDASQKKVEKVETVINIAKAVNGSKFIHVHLRCETNDVHRLEENVRTLGSNIVERTGIPLEGNEIYVRTAQSESKEKVARENSSFENFMQRNKNSLVENLEPISLITNSNISFLDSKTMKKMETFENRRERANYFLKICLHLPTEDQEMVITLLKEIIVSSKEVPEAANLGPVRCRIKKHQEALLDEIDTELIKTTVNRIENVPNEVYTSLMDQSKGRKEKAKIFLEFVLIKDEYVLALKETCKENGIEYLEEEIA
ncbi:uncharacterized protein [Magallana gigas]|uniref:uncharacterized protein isoform X2 n=1 Tax=Magallana gigas TaxID=29159 RepID=UPI00333F421A